MLTSIHTQGVGPVRDLSANFGKRLNVVTGDNGLGKSFLLDLSFWCLTGMWPGGRIAIPDANVRKPSIEYGIRGRTRLTSHTAVFDFGSQAWVRPVGRPPMPGLVIYAAVDGSFAVWDPARNYWRDPEGEPGRDPLPKTFDFRPDRSSDRADGGTRTSRRDVANGLEESGRVLCNGLITDWSEWFYRRTETTADPNAFQLLERALVDLSHPLEPLRCEEPRRVFVDDARKFPVLSMPYGTVTYPQWSAGIRRVVNFAYLIVWAWVEHVQAAALRQDEPTTRMVLIVDEIEAHLHPKWQRTILPSILRVVDGLKAKLDVQVHAATHSPLVLASLEPHFDPGVDRLFCFNLHGERPLVQNRVTFDQLPWTPHGDVVGWLTSDVFGLAQARSREAEAAIEAAEAFLRDDPSQIPESLANANAITAELKRVLPDLDPFWPRWIVEVTR